MVVRIQGVAVAVLLGAASTVLVAWACEAWSGVECVELQNAATPRPSEVSGAWASAAASQEGRGFGRTTLWYRRGAAGDVGVHRAGWPFRSLQYQIDEAAPAGPSFFPVAPAASTRWAIDIPDWRPVPRGLVGLALPTRPLPLGFALDAAFYGLVFLPAVSGVIGFVRGRARARRGLCRGCGYLVGVSPVCTECGRPVRRPPPAGGSA